MTKARGFTLVELITVIVILGVVGIGIASFVRGTMQIYLDVNTREALLTESRFAIERMTRELRRAVPNSIRIRGDSTQHCIEFVPSQFSTIYTELPVQPSTETTVSLVFPYDIDGNVFDIDSTDFAIVYPRRSEDVYDLSRNKRKIITSCSDDGDGDCSTRDDSDDIIQIEVDDAFAERSPASRLYFADGSVSFCVLSGVLVRFENDIEISQAVGSLATARLATDVVNVLSSNPVVAPQQDDPFTYFAATLQRNAVVQLRLRFARDGEQVEWHQEVHIANVP
ncbi:PulJ/GspJ family protein [Alteromonas antoniana]|uniref:PulJ/GspJ family protein n=1 Tax=Alteromonas antoniana TaxID=2803813 RepID=UPI001C441058|nr:type II secretion system protein [Alteromonas antoniana]